MKRKLIAFILSVCMIIPAFALNAKIPDAKVFVDGEQVDILAYNIGGANYFKLRDLAMALAQTDAGFAVLWNADTQTVEITTNAQYEPIGGELMGGGTNNAVANASTHKVIVDGEKANLSAYNIGGANYFKLRDVLSEIGAGVTWDEVRRHVLITTKNVSVDKFAIANDAVVTIKATDEDDNISGEGVGVLVSNDGKILTSYNVIKRAHRARATYLKDGEQHDIKGIIAYDAKRNLALLASEIKTDASVTLAENSPAEGEACTAIFARDELDSGVCKGFREDDYSSGWQTELAIKKESWGVPVLNSEGELLGIGYSRIWDNTEVGMIAPVSDLKHWLSKTEITSLEKFLSDNYPLLDKKEISDIRGIIHARHPKITTDRARVGIKGLALQKLPDYYKRLYYAMFIEDETQGTYIYEDWFGENHDEIYSDLKNYAENLLETTANYFPEYEVIGEIYIPVISKEDPGDADEVSHKYYDSDKDVWHFRYCIFWFEKTDLSGFRTVR